MGVWSMTGPLEGIKVLELSRHLAGPFAAMTLGDLGADVLKIEPPGRGDDTRGFPPYWNGESCYFLSTNRNKRSMTLDLGAAEGQAILRELLADTDILIENFRTGTMDRWGLGYEQLRSAYPRLIYCAISAVGSDGPDRDRAGVDLLMQAYGGLMSITGEEGGAPVRVGTSLVDLTTGANAVQGILRDDAIRRGLDNAAHRLAARYEERPFVIGSMDACLRYFPGVQRRTARDVALLPAAAASLRVLLLMAEHAVHHCSQRATYARSNGWPVADLLGRSYEDLEALQTDGRRAATD